LYNGRGTAEQWVKEGKDAIRRTRLSCHDFRDNEVRLQLLSVACNLGNFLRRLAFRRSVKEWSLTTLREKLIKIGVKVAGHASSITFQTGEVAVPRRLFEQILARIEGCVPHRPDTTRRKLSRASRSGSLERVGEESRGLTDDRITESKAPWEGLSSSLGQVRSQENSAQKV